jgi:2-iminoacetate synthase
MSTAIIDENQINGLLNEAGNATKEEINAIVEKAKECNGLSLGEAAKLLQIEDQSLLENLFNAARWIKHKIYGKRIVIFTPLYSSSACSNNCLYCGFRAANKEMERKTLNLEEIRQETRAIEKEGHKRILLVCGEDRKNTDIDHITGAVKAIYEAGDIRRINVNAAPMSVADFKKLKRAGIGTYQIFQETYHRESYKKMHPAGLKADYDYRLTAVERALEAGIDDYGIGVLLGLYDYRFDVLATLMHAEYMEKQYGIGPHTISIPRLRPAPGAAIEKAPNPVSDQDFKKITAIYRLAVPYTGIILSTRESEEVRNDVLNLGVSQISAGSKTSPGGHDKKNAKASQFETSDERSLDQMLTVICKQGHLPSFCTACYRTNRTGKAFMDLVKDFDINDLCQLNALLTFKENLMDFASEETVDTGEIIIRESLEEMADPGARAKIEAALLAIEKGQRDLFR